MPANLIVLERGLVMQDVGTHCFAGQCIAQSFGDDLGVVTAAGDLVEQLIHVVDGHHASVSPGATC